MSAIEKEIQRIRLLGGYNLKNTLSENKNLINKKIINEQIRRSTAEASELLAKELRAAEKIKASMKDLNKVKGISKQIEKTVFADLSKSFGGVVNKGGQQLKSIDDIVNAVKKGDIMPAELGKFNMSMLKSDISASSEASKRIAKDIGTNSSTIQRYSKYDYDTIVQDLMKQKNIPYEKAKLIADEIEVVRKQANLIDDVVKQSDDAIRQSDDAIRQSDDAIKLTSPGKGGKPPKKKIIDPKTGEDITSQVKKIDDEIATIGKETELTSKQTQKIESLIKKEKEITKLREAEVTLKEAKKANPRGVIGWFKENGFIRGMGKIIFNKYVLALAIIGGGGYLIWKNFFQDNGISVQDDGTGTDITGGGGEGGSSDGSGGGISPEQEAWENDPNAGDGEPGDPLLGKYKKCSKVYKLLCLTTRTYPMIQLLQRDVGVKETGKWGRKTDLAVRNKYGQSELTDAEIRDYLDLDESGSLPGLS